MADINKAAYPVRQVVPVGAVHNRLSLEIARGCTRGCRFCHAGVVYRPVRERSLENIHSLLRRCLDETGFDEISFLSLSTGDYSALKTLSLSVLDRCAEEQISLSLPSLRVGSIDDAIMERMAELRRTGCTLAPEAGSQRLRDVNHKGVSEEGLLLHVQKLLEHGWAAGEALLHDRPAHGNGRGPHGHCRPLPQGARRRRPRRPRLQVTAALLPLLPKPLHPFPVVAQSSPGRIRRR